MTDQDRPAMSYKVRVLTDDDVPAVIDMYNEAFPDTNKTTAWWHWWFRDNPAGAGMAVVAEGSDGTFAGMFHLAPVRLWHRGEEVIVAQDQLGVVHPDYRGQRVFTNLARELYRLARENFPFIFCQPNTKVMPAYKHVGAELRSVGHFYTRATDEAANDASGHELTQVSGFTEAHDRLWATVRERLRTAQIRDTRYLNWRFVDPRAGKEYLIYNLLDKKGEVAGYMVFQPFGDRLDLLDYCLIPGTGIGDPRLAIGLLDRAAADLGQRSVAVWALDAHKDLISLIDELGFEITQREFPLLSRDFDEADRYRLLNDVSKWAYTAGDLELF
jgi:GNAT superfamily N-acetyltransferase